MLNKTGFAISIAIILLGFASYTFSDDATKVSNPLPNQATPKAIQAPSATLTTQPTTTSAYEDITWEPHHISLAQPDAFEPINRAFFTFNDKFDEYFFKPLATFYNRIMPKPLNRGIHNAFLNIGTIPIVVNDILQLHFCDAAHDTWRLGVNTTVGILGFFDVANHIQLKPYVNDFGLTLYQWGYHHSNYLVIPFFGSYTFRDGIGFFVDYFVFSIYPYINPPSLRYEIYALGAIDRRAYYLKYQNVMEEASFDKYIFIRNAYFQHRANEIEIDEERPCERPKNENLYSITSLSEMNHA